MTQVAHVRPAPTLPVVASSSAAPSPIPSVLPVSTKPSVGAMNDALSQLYAMVSQQRDAQANLSKGQNDVAEAERKAASHRQEYAMQRAQEAAAKGGFFDWVSKDIGLAGAVGLVKFNYALAVADIAAHKLGVFDHLEEKVDLVDAAAVATGRWDVVAADVVLRKTDLAPDEARRFLERCGLGDVPGVSNEDVKPVAKDLLMANLMILALAASVLSCGSTAALVVALVGFAVSQAGSYVARNRTFGENSESIGLGMQIAGAVAMAGAGCASAGSVTEGAKVATVVASSASSIAHGTDRIVVAVHEHQRDVANMQVAAARHRLTQVQRIAETVLEQATEANESHRKAAETIQGIIEKVNAMQMAMVQGVRA